MSIFCTLPKGTHPPQKVMLPSKCMTNEEAFANWCTCSVPCSSTPVAQRYDPVNVCELFWFTKAGCRIKHNWYQWSLRYTVYTVYSTVCGIQYCILLWCFHDLRSAEAGQAISSTANQIGQLGPVPQQVLLHLKHGVPQAAAPEWMHAAPAPCLRECLEPSRASSEGAALMEESL